MYCSRRACARTMFPGRRTRPAGECRPPRLRPRHSPLRSQAAAPRTARPGPNTVWPAQASGAAHIPGCRTGRKPHSRQATGDAQTERGTSCCCSRECGRHGSEVRTLAAGCKRHEAGGGVFTPSQHAPGHAQHAYAHLRTGYSGQAPTGPRCVARGEAAAAKGGALRKRRGRPKRVPSQACCCRHSRLHCRFILEV